MCSLKGLLMDDPRFEYISNKFFENKKAWQEIIDKHPERKDITIKSSDDVPAFVEEMQFYFYKEKEKEMLVIEIPVIKEILRTLEQKPEIVDEILNSTPSVNNRWYYDEDEGRCDYVEDDICIVERPYTANVALWAEGGLTDYAESRFRYDECYTQYSNYEATYNSHGLYLALIDELVDAVIWMNGDEPDEYYIEDYEEEGESSCDYESRTYEWPTFTAILLGYGTGRIVECTQSAVPSLLASVSIYDDYWVLNYPARVQLSVSGLLALADFLRDYYLATGKHYPKEELKFSLH